MKNLFWMMGISVFFFGFGAMADDEGKALTSEELKYYDQVGKSAADGLLTFLNFAVEKGANELGEALSNAGREFGDGVRTPVVVGPTAETSPVWVQYTDGYWRTTTKDGRTWRSRNGVTELEPQLAYAVTGCQMRVFKNGKSIKYCPK